MLENGASSTTIGIYTRCIRALFNEAIEAGFISREYYPFGKKRYQIPASQNIKKALSSSDLRKLFHYRAEKGSKEEWALDMWKFSYLCNGMNIKDIAHLKFQHVKKDEIIFVRAKTANATKTNQKAIVAPLLPVAKKILSRWQNADHSHNNYVFEILKENLDAVAAQAKVRQSVKTINKYVKRIATTLKVHSSVTSYTARHSWATMMLHKNAPLAYISDGLGHRTIRTTQRYFGGFGSTIGRKFAQKLVEFK